MFDMLKDTQNSSSVWLNVVPSLEKLYQAVAARNEQVNLQPTLNKCAGGASPTIFVTDWIYCTMHIIIDRILSVWKYQIWNFN